MLNQFKKISLILGIGLFFSMSAFAQCTCDDIQINIPTNTTAQSGLRVTSPGVFPLGTPINSLFQVRQAAFQPGTYFNHFTIRTNGRIGVGTDNPTSKLQVHDGRIHITGTNSAGGPMIAFGNTPPTAPADNGQWAIEYVDNTATTSGLNFWKPWPSTNNGNNFLFLNNNGQVGMGVDPVDFSNPATSNFRLHVRDGIITEKVKVELIANWPDFVFEDDYKMRTLKEVEEFIKANKHLPGVPSEQDVLENGINLGEMDATLLRKIEELTLYILKQNEKLETLTERLHDLENKN